MVQRRAALLDGRAGGRVLGDVDLTAALAVCARDAVGSVLATARLEQAVRDSAQGFSERDRNRLAGSSAMTLHRLLRPRPGNRTRFRHHRGNRLPHDVVVVDETSMVSLTMMARLLEAVRPDSRLIFVGDPDQLSSVDAGAVLSDIVHGFDGRAELPPTVLRRVVIETSGRDPVSDALVASRVDLATQ